MMKQVCICETRELCVALRGARSFGVKGGGRLGAERSLEKMQLQHIQKFKNSNYTIARTSSAGPSFPPDARAAAIRLA